MKCQIPQIFWHSRDPVLSVDFQPIDNGVFRLASGGTDKHVVIWYVTYQENNSVKIECASDMSRHNKSVNVVRFSPSGEFLASGDDEGAMFIWRLKERDQIDLPKDDEEINKEEWYPAKLLRGHLEDINDISWSKDGSFLVSASLDNTAIVWDMQKYVKVHMFSEFKGYVQGVSWDPLNQYIASIGTDRTLRLHNINSKKVAYRASKAPWTNATERGTFKSRLFYDDTLKSYSRRLTFTPDGELLIVPSGIVEKGDRFHNTTYVFSKYAPSKPVVSLPTGDKYTVAVRCNPFLYKLRRDQNDASDKENEKPKVMIDLPYRMVFAVAASDAVLFYDTEQLAPFAYVSNIHYAHLSDLTWSPDGLTLVTSSTDGYCTFIIFSRDELGEIYVPEPPKEPEENLVEMAEAAERKDVCELSHVQADEVEKDSYTPVRPKGSSVTKSPKDAVACQITKEESGTPLSKNVKSSSESKKSNKSPKMCSIKKFFMSTKPVTSTSNADKVLETSKQKTGMKSCNNASVTEVITILDTPEKAEEKCEKTANNTENVVTMAVEKENSKSTVPLADTEVMDVDGEDAELSKKQETSTGETPKKQTKCKVRLDFTSQDKDSDTKSSSTSLKLEPVKIIDDNASDVDTIMSSSSNEQSVIKSEMRANETDWKLELSQDEEIIPMETTSKVADKKPVVLEESTPAVSDKNPEKQKPTKRRIAFVTLSSSIKK